MKILGLELIQFLAIYGGLVVGTLLSRVEKRFKIEPGVLLLIYLAGFLVACLMGV